MMSPLQLFLTKLDSIGTTVGGVPNTTEELIPLYALCSIEEKQTIAALHQTKIKAAEELHADIEFYQSELCHLLPIIDTIGTLIQDNA